MMNCCSTYEMNQFQATFEKKSEWILVGIPKVFLLLDLTFASTFAELFQHRLE